MPMEKTFSPAEAEARIAARWEAENAFAAGANARPKADGSPAETFCIMIPPPNVTGSLHMGHAFNNTLQDILVRWHRMRGHDVLWQPGQDHAGIATQMVVERELAKSQQPSRRAMGREAFVQKVWEWKAESGGTIVGQLKRLGCSLDWSRNAFTMSGAPGAPAGEEGNFHDAVIKVFVDLYNKGLIYRGKRLVNWDPHFETAISDLEVENIEVAGHMWHFKYPLAGGETYEYIEKDAEGNVTLRETRDYISIATTRPETMLGDGAVAVHPSDARYAPIVGKLCEIPVGPKEHRRLIPIITDEYPDPNFGSGAVKITGAHDFNDYAVAKRGNIPCYRLMDTRAQMRADGAPYAEAAEIALAVARGERTLSEAEVDTINLVPDDLRGLDRFEARDRVVAQITAEGLAVMTTADDPNTSPPSVAMEDRRKRKELGVWRGPNGEYYVKETVGEAIKAAQLNYPEREVLLDSGEEPMGDGFYNPSTRADIVWLRRGYPLVDAKPIMQPFGDRSKTVIEPMLTDQWFVDTARIVQPALDAVRDGRTRIMPPSGEKTYYHWLENIEPWCISRQLWWGHQIPVWYGPIKAGDKDTTEAFGLTVKGFCAADKSQLVEQLEAYYGDEKFYFFSDEDSYHEFRNLGLSGELTFEPGEGVHLGRDPDVLDTWFSSGLWPIGTLGWPEQTPELQKYFPTDVLITGSDILFFWVARMMMMQLAVVGQVPFHTVYLHGLVRDAKGKKMSKSLGNVVDPLDLIDEFGADALRFTNAAMASLGGVLKLDTQRIAGYRNFGTKLWNATRFAEMNAVFDAPLGRPAPAHTVNRWIIGEVARTREAVDEALTNFRFNDAANTLYAFVWGKVCDWYVEFAKPIFDGEHAAETRQTMRWVLDQCFTLLHPMMPFITEELWSMTGQRAKMLVHGDWPEYGAELIDEAADREMNWVIQLIEEIRSARSQMGVPAALKITMLTTEADDAARAALAHNEALILRLARLETIADGTTPKGAISLALPGAAFALPLAGIIDVAAEKARLSKAHDKLEKDLNGLRGRLGNPKFVASAPAEIVEENRELLAAGDAEAQKLRAALARLADLE